MKAISKKKIRVLITTVVKEGVDFPISPVVAINASGKKSFINVVQFFGRIVRKNETFGDFRVFIDFIDTAHPLLKKHSDERMIACKDIGAEVIVVETIMDLVKEVVKYYKQVKP